MGFYQEGLYSLAFCLLPYIKNHVRSRCFWGCTKDLLSEMWLQRVADRVITRMSSGLLTYVLPHHAGSFNIFIFICILVIQFINKNTTVKRKIWKLFLRFIFCNFWTHYVIHLMVTLKGHFTIILTSDCKAGTDEITYFLFLLKLYCNSEQFLSCHLQVLTNHNRVFQIGKLCQDPKSVFQTCQYITSISKPLSA